MNKLCCMSLTLGARIIGAFGLSASILMINVLMSDFFAKKEESRILGTIETWALLGLNWTQFVKEMRSTKQVQILLACVMVYSIFLLLASAFLALGTITRRPNYAIPWLYIQMFCIVDQAASVCFHLTRDLHYDEYNRAKWFLPLSFMCLVATVYFWMVVYYARQEWYKYVAPYNNFEFFAGESSALSQADFNMPKTPSFLAQNHSIFDSPPANIPIKYDIV